MNTTSKKELEDVFNEKINLILNALGIEIAQQKSIIDGFKQYTDSDKIKILDNIDNHISNLTQADTNFTEFLKNGILKKYSDKINPEWANMTKQLAELQGLIILKKVNKDNCDEVIKTLLSAITSKLTNVNTIIKEDLTSHINNNTQAGGNNYTDNNNDLMYKSKYLKYKNKYLKYKNK